jgi:hypothetical protein
MKRADMRQFASIVATCCLAGMPFVVSAAAPAGDGALGLARPGRKPVNRTTRRGGAGIVALTAMLAWPAVTQAAAPLKEYTKGSGDDAYLEIFDDANYVYIYVAKYKSTETKGKEVAVLNYFYHNDLTDASGNGYCTIPTSSLSGEVSARRGRLSMNRINTASLIEGRDCAYKIGGNLTAIDIEWEYNGEYIDYLDGTKRSTQRFPDGTRYIESSRGKNYFLSANARVSIIGDDVGIVAGTIGYPDGTLDGFAELSTGNQSWRSFSRTVEAPTGTP